MYMALAGVWRRKKNRFITLEDAAHMNEGLKANHKLLSYPKVLFLPYFVVVPSLSQQATRFNNSKD